LTVPVLSKELREPHFRACLHRGVYEEFDTVLDPHSPLPLPHMRHKDEFEVDPVRVDAFINIRIRFDPVAIDVARVRLLRTEAPIKENLLDPSSPERLEGGTKTCRSSKSRLRTESVDCGRERIGDPTLRFE
jgi:hypothetical protein